MSAHCLFCSRELESDAILCIHCGKFQYQCKVCKKEIDFGQRICPHCNFDQNANLKRFFRSNRELFLSLVPIAISATALIVTLVPNLLNSSDTKILSVDVRHQEMKFTIQNHGNKSAFLKPSPIGMLYLQGVEHSGVYDIELIDEDSPEIKPGLNSFKTKLSKVLDSAKAKDVGTDGCNVRVYAYEFNKELVAAIRKSKELSLTQNTCQTYF